MKRTHRTSRLRQSELGNLVKNERLPWSLNRSHVQTQSVACFLFLLLRVPKIQYELSKWIVTQKNKKKIQLMTMCTSFPNPRDKSLFSPFFSPLHSSSRYRSGRIWSRIRMNFIFISKLWFVQTFETYNQCGSAILEIFFHRPRETRPNTHRVFFSTFCGVRTHWIPRTYSERQKYMKCFYFANANQFDIF